MTTIYKCLAALTGMIFFLSTAQPATKEEISTLDVAETVLQKGLSTIDLGLYPGILLMHGMSEMALLDESGEELREAVAIFRKYKTGEIRGRGNFISYEPGGSGAAYLSWKGVAPALDAQVEEAAIRFFRDQKRSPEGLMTSKHAKDTLEQLFIDVAFAVTPYLLYSGLKMGNREYVDFAVRETLELFRILKDSKTGLLHQARGFTGRGNFTDDNWSRGNGWGAFALSVLARDLPAEHPRRAEVEQLARTYFAAVLAHQDKNGLWHQEMSDKTSYVETSGSGLFLYGLGIMLEKELLQSRYRKNVVKGLRSYLGYIGCDGSVSHTCQGCLSPGKGKKEDYKNREWIFNDPHAFGPVVLAFTQAHKIGIKEIEPIPGEGCTSVTDTVAGRPGTYVRYISERKEDIAWESDRIAFRVYGPPVKDKVGSGVDVWVKSVRYPVINKWYLLNGLGKAYHTDRGEGCDFYEVGHFRGCGGTAVWENGKPFVSQPYARHRILKNSRKEIVFELTFAEWDVNGYQVSEKKTISMKKGSNLYKVTSVISCGQKTDLTVGVGLTSFGNPAVKEDREKGILSLWEQVHPDHGYLGSGVIVDPGDLLGYETYGNDRFALIRVRSGEPFTYYAGAGWDGSSFFRHLEDWLTWLDKASKKLF